jgi:oxalate decarboxylase/phosphoglucose isomerase-like protein (cupin superfamily)
MALDIFKNDDVKITRSEWSAGTDFIFHLHKNLNKIIFVEKGSIKVIITDQFGKSEEHIVSAQKNIFVPANTYRQIIVLEDSIFFKFYWHVKNDKFYEKYKI